jgi:hypothetical protein
MASPYDALRASVRDAADPLSALQRELRDFAASLALPASGQLLPFAALRAALDECAEKVAHECRRCVLVYCEAEASQGGLLPRAAAGSVASMAAEAVARLCAVVQGLGAHARQGLGGPLLPGACFCEDLEAASAGLLAAAREFVAALQGCALGPAQGGSPGDVRVGGCRRRLAQPCAMVGQWSSESIRLVPKTLATAVKRRFISACLTMRSSALDLRKETGVETLASTGAAVAGGGGEGGSAGSSSSSSNNSASTAAVAVVNHTVALFKAQTALLNCASALVDTASPPPLQQPGAEPHPQALQGGGAAAAADAVADSPDACHLDTLAKACKPLVDAVIDLAAATSDAFDSLGGGGPGQGEDDEEDDEGFEEEEEEEEESEEDSNESNSEEEGPSSAADRASSSVAALREALAPVRASFEGLHRQVQACLLRMQALALPGAAAQLEALQGATAQCREAEAALQRQVAALEGGGGGGGQPSCAQ